MPIPPNITALTAEVVTSLPFTASPDAHFSGTTYDLWYAYTPTVDEEVSIFGFGDLTTYEPGIKIYTGPASAPVAYLGFTFGTDNRAAQAPFFAGVTYYIEFETNPGNPTPAILLIEMEAFVQQAAPAASVLVNDDTVGYPLVILSATDGEVLRFDLTFPNGEAGDILDDGYSCWHDADTDELKIFAPDLTLVTTLTGYNLPGLGGMIRTCRGTQRFWTATMSGADAHVRYITSAGAAGTVHVMTGVTSVAALAANNDETILYWSRSTSGQRQIRRYDLVNDVALSDLAAAIDNDIPFDILVLSDDTILTSAVRTTVGGSVKVRRYNAAGTLLNTYDFGDGTVNDFPGGTLPRICYAVDDPVSFWIWRHLQTPDNGNSRFANIRISDGSVLTTFDVAEYEGGIWQPDVVADPQPRFGISFSCPFMISRTEIGSSVPVPPDSGINGPEGLAFLRSSGLLVTVPIVRQRRFPHLSDEMQRIFHKMLQIDIEAGVGTVSGQGVLPDLRVRWSDDGGFTWSNGRTLGVGAQGAYKFECYTHALGSARDRVYEITQSDPVKTVWVAAYLDMEEGSH